MNDPTPSTNTTRRSFLKGTSAAVLGAPLLGETKSAAPAPRAAAHGEDTIRIGLIGCGGRGTGAANQALSTAGSVQLVAMGDAFADRLDSSLETLSREHPEAVLVPEERRFVGFDAYRQVIDSDIDLVVLATPPGFRPPHFEYAVEKDKHVFMEKPVAVDGSGIRRVLAAAAQSREKDLKVGVGLQRHHEAKYRATIQRIHDGAIGEVLFYRCYWNMGNLWVVPRKEGMTEMEYQMRNWYYFNWLCGDHIVEQHIHNIDVCNWIQGGYPVRAQGQGGRQVRTGLDHGEIFDHHMVEFTYEDGTKMISQCRQTPDTWTSVSEHAHGTRGFADVSAGKIVGSGGWTWRFEGENPNPYQVEHDELFAAVRSGASYNEAENGAHSTMTAILGRMATYSGKELRFDAALASELDTMPAALAWNVDPPTLPDASGAYPIPMPGVTRVV